MSVPSDGMAVAKVLDVILTPGADKALGRSSFSWCPVARARGVRGRRS